MQLEILNPEGALYSGEVDSVKLPGAQGQFQVLNNHAPLVSSLIEGTIVCKTKEGDKTFDIKSGVAEVLQNKVIVLV